MSAVRAAMIIAPFWRQEGHVGVLRIQRFMRWLSSEGARIVLVYAGASDGVEERPWGVEVRVRDPLGLNWEAPVGAAPPPVGAVAPPARRNRLLRAAGLAILAPDPAVAWACRAARHAGVLERARDVDLVISSSPPESAHLAAVAVARRCGKRVLIDLRDGWLDEPLKPQLRSSRLRRWREGRMESRVLARADRVLVSSPGWRTLLLRRRPGIAAKVAVLTNAYPDLQAVAADRRGDRLRLIHTGRFTGSRSTQSVDLLLAPLFAAAGDRDVPAADIVLRGGLEPDDLQRARVWADRLGARGWSLAIEPSIGRAAMMAELAAADGLLLLAASQAAVPSKFYEYLVVGRPILAVAPRDSAVWTMSASLPQVILADGDSGATGAAAAAFLGACRDRDRIHPVPLQYSDASLRRLFLEHVREICSGVQRES